MKRALPGKKRKQAIPARKPATKRPPTSTKIAFPKPAVKKRAPARTTKTIAATSRIAKAKSDRRKPARRRIAKNPIRKEIKLSAAEGISATTRDLSARRDPIEVPPSGDWRPEPPEIGTPNQVTLPPEVSQKAGPQASRATVPKAQVTLPAFLLEGDEPSHPEISGPGEKFSLGPTPPLDHFDEAKAPLPESYGTGRLFLTARDPHWLYAHWDFTMQEQFRYNARSVDRHMVLRLHDTRQPDQHISEIHVHPESRHWFTHVDNAGEKYIAEIGYYQAGRKWKSLATSEPQRTPPDNISADSSIEFATIPLELSFETMLALLKEHPGTAAAEDLPLARSIEQIRTRARQHFPPRPPATDWTPEQEQALAEILVAARAGGPRPSSEEFAAPETAEFRPEFVFDVETGEAAPLPSPSSHVSSFFGGAAPQDFWFNVNAELIIYGATEPNATVTFAGKQIALQPDGSFRFRFALPDGQYELPVTAISADGTDGRAAELKFTRATEVRGHVATAPTDPALKPPPQSS